MLTGSGFDVALGFERARTTLQEEVGTFTTGQFALGTNVTSHFSLSPFTRDASSADGTRYAGWASRR
ncbi:hypothetical protein D3C77_732570 [compost metagenome]